jgi:hypothetical protein
MARVDTILAAVKRFTFTRTWETRNRERLAFMVMKNSLDSSGSAR